MRLKGSSNKTAGLSPSLDTRSVHAADAAQAGEAYSRFFEGTLAARNAARINGEYFTADEALRELDELHTSALAGPGK